MKDGSELIKINKRQELASERGYRTRGKEPVASYWDPFKSNF